MADIEGLAVDKALGTQGVCKLHYPGKSFGRSVFLSYGARLGTDGRVDHGLLVCKNGDDPAFTGKLP